MILRWKQPQPTYASSENGVVPKFKFRTCHSKFVDAHARDCLDDPFVCLFGLGLHPWRQAAQVSSAFGWSLSSETLSKGIVSDRRTSRLLADVPRTQQWQEAHGCAHRATHVRNHSLALRRSTYERIYSSTGDAHAHRTRSRIHFKC